MQQKLMLELTKYIGTKYYNTEMDVVFADSLENKTNCGVYYHGEKIEYYLDNFQFYFECLDYLKNVK